VFFDLPKAGVSSVLGFFMMSRFILLSLILFTTTARGEDSALLQKAMDLHLAESTEWKRLLHYRGGIFGSETSQVAGKDFFLGPAGKTDPVSELKATIAGFQKPLSEFPKDQDPDLTLKPTDTELLHPLCRFPARAMFLGKALGVDFFQMIHPHCFHFEDFKKKLDAVSATLVFSSFYLGSPSSTFGHTFLQIRSHRALGTQGERVELLDHGINYAASMTTSNPLLYSLYGMIGAFKGTFTSVPFYFKVREYNDFESRDLWSYDLVLTQPELDMLVAHIWELGFTYYDYFYFTQNCSFHMFTTLEAAAPRLHLTDRLPFYVIPSDTIRKLVEEPGLVSAVHYRPSNRAQFEKRLAQLSSAEKSSLKQIAVDRDFTTYEKQSSAVSLEEKAKVLDASLDYLEFANPHDVAEQENSSVTIVSESSKYKQELLLERAKLGVKSVNLSVEPEDRLRPHVSHGIRRLALAYGFESNEGPSLRLGLRFALHDELDPSPGYPPLAGIEFMHLKTRYEVNSKVFSLDELALFQVLALTPYDSFHHKPSYRVQLAVSKFREEGQCVGNRCYGPELDVAFGFTFSILGRAEHPGLAAYVLPEFQNQISGGFRGSEDHLSLGGRAGFLGELSEYSHLKFEVHPAYFFFSPKPFTLDSSLEWRQNPSLSFGYGLQVESLDSKLKDYDYSAQIYYYF